MDVRERERNLRTKIRKWNVFQKLLLLKKWSKAPKTVTKQEKSISFTYFLFNSLFHSLFSFLSFFEREKRKHLCLDVKYFHLLSNFIQGWNDNFSLVSRYHTSNIRTGISVFQHPWATWKVTKSNRRNCTSCSRTYLFLASLSLSLSLFRGTPQNDCWAVSSSSSSFPSSFSTFSLPKIVKKMREREDKKMPRKRRKKEYWKQFAVVVT